MATSAPVVPGETPGTRAPLVLGKPTFKTISEDISSIVEARYPRAPDAAVNSA